MKKLMWFAALLVGALLEFGAAQSQETGWTGASWIWDEANANTKAQDNEPRRLRLAFKLATKPQAAELWITADNHYIAYVNGQKVGEDKEWATVEKYDVAKHLVAGKNVLAIQATNAGGVAGAIARLHFKTAENKDVFVVTNEKTKIWRAEPRKGPVDNAWTKTDFDDSVWSNAIVLGDISITPWNIGGSVADATGSVGKGKGKKGGGQFGYDTNETVAVKGRLTPEEQIKHFVVPKDFEIELVAADPLVINPITMVMDEKGRIIVSESHTYRYGPKGSPIKPYANPVIRLDPDGKGGFKRTLIAEGFADPVMGIAVKGDKMWLTACDYLYTYDLPPSPPGRGAGGEGGSDKNKGASPSPTAPLPEGERSQKPLATNKKTLITDLTHAWNPFGMFVLEWGPDGKLYMSVGNHNIKLQSTLAPGGRGKGEGDILTSRGGSGMIVRMNPDGTKMERLVHGLRVPYSFEMDPFGQLWLLSNGEGNPNRLVRVIQGVDYHCYSRGAVGNDWLAGNHPLAPPSEELHRGAHTQLMRYYGAAYPQEYQGNLFLCNWGAHGFAGPNRGIFRFVPDERNNISKREPLVWCKDPHFRPSHIILDQDGSLLIADWYGRDDESDLTGRIWRLKYVGKNAPVVKHKLDAPEWKGDDYAIEALGSPDHLIREKAMEVLGERMLANKKPSQAVAFAVAEHASKSTEPLAAANAMWTLQRTGLWKVLAFSGCKNPDWRVRRLAFNLVHQNGGGKGGEDRLKQLLESEQDPVVRIMIALNFGTSEEKTGALLQAISNGKAADIHLRYEAGWHIAKLADEKTITRLLTSDDANVRLAGLIAIDIACYENFPSKKAAMEALAKALENPGKLDHQLLLKVAELDGDASIVPALVKLIEREDMPTATTAKALLVLKAKAANPLLALRASEGARKRLIEAVERGTLTLKTKEEQLVLFEFLEVEGPTPFALKQIGGQLQSSHKELREAAHTLARRFGPNADSLAVGLWPSVLNPKTKFEDAIESLSTIARTEKSPQKRQWEQLLDHEDPLIRMETVRWWRRFTQEPGFQVMLAERAVGLQKKDAAIVHDLQTVAAQLSGEKVPIEFTKDDLTTYTLGEMAKMPATDRAKRSAMGLQVFERNACTKCHTTATATTLLAPSLKGIAAQKVDYLIESILEPSKIIKTGWEIEQIETKDGKVISGLVKDEGKSVRVIQAMDYLGKPLVIDKANIESRQIAKTSLMPQGQEATMSRREFVDLICYLQTLK